MGHVIMPHPTSFRVFAAYVTISQPIQNELCSNKTDKIDCNFSLK